MTDRPIKTQQYLGNSKIKKLRYVEPYEYDELQRQNKVEPDCLYIIVRS